MPNSHTDNNFCQPVKRGANLPSIRFKTLTNQQKKNSPIQVRIGLLIGVIILFLYSKTEPLTSLAAFSFKIVLLLIRVELYIEIRIMFYNDNIISTLARILLEVVVLIKLISVASKALIYDRGILIKE
jgi:hypothetical protein